MFQEAEPGPRRCTGTAGSPEGAAGAPHGGAGLGSNLLTRDKARKSGFHLSLFTAGTFRCPHPMAASQGNDSATSWRNLVQVLHKRLVPTHTCVTTTGCTESFQGIL